jgi:hypothetical protein
MTFGSGTIEAVFAKEVVRVGHLSVDMADGILLMVARKLNIEGKFEGILGLGLPTKLMHEHKGKSHNHHAETAEYDLKDMIKKIIETAQSIFGGDGDSGDTVDADAIVAVPPDKNASTRLGTKAKAPQKTSAGQSGSKEAAVDIGRIVQQLGMSPGVNFAPAFEPMSGHLSHEIASHSFGWRQPQDVAPKSLLEQAGISRFSMCFNDGASGVLRLGTPEVPNSLGSVGEYHWGLDFRGVSIGDKAVPLSFCSSSNMTDGQETPCGAIPDSGTTVIMAPKEHLAVLLDSICDQWPRCAENFTAMTKAADAAKLSAKQEYSWDPFEIAPAEKFQVLQLLLLDCGLWLNENGLDELPTLKFHVMGAGGKQQVLDLPGWAYILESSHEDVDRNSHLQGLDTSFAFLQNRTKRKTKVCSPAFGAMDYTTKKNGPVWILGTPFFYEFQVGYDLNATPPAISFTSVETEPCVSCGREAALLSTQVSSQRRPRWISGPVRVPELDMDLPL